LFRATAARCRRALRAFVSCRRVSPSVFAAHPVGGSLDQQCQGSCLERIRVIAEMESADLSRQLTRSVNQCDPARAGGGNRQYERDRFEMCIDKKDEILV